MLLPKKDRKTQLSLGDYAKEIAGIGHRDGGRAAWEAGWGNVAVWLAHKYFPDEIGSAHADEFHRPFVSMALLPYDASAERATGGILIKNGTWKPVVWNWRARWNILVIPNPRKRKKHEEVAIVLIPISDIMLRGGRETFGFDAGANPEILIRSVFVPKHRTVSLKALMRGDGNAQAGYWQYRLSAAALLTIHAVLPLYGVAAAARAPASGRQVLRRDTRVTLEALRNIDAATHMLSGLLQRMQVRAICNVPLVTDECRGIRRTAVLAGHLILTAVDSLASICHGKTDDDQIEMQSRWRDARTLGLCAEVAIRSFATLFEGP